MMYEKLTGPLDPFWRPEFNAATIASTIAEVSRDPKGKKKRPWSNKDFMMNWSREVDEQEEKAGGTAAKILNLFKGLASAAKENVAARTNRGS